eukprot:2672997-Rhodomonas_salina.3
MGFAMVPSAGTCRSDAPVPAHTRERDSVQARYRKICPTRSAAAVRGARHTAPGCRRNGHPHPPHQ